MADAYLPVQQAMPQVLAEHMAAGHSFVSQGTVLTWAVALRPIRATKSREAMIFIMRAGYGGKSRDGISGSQSDTFICKCRSSCQLYPTAMGLVAAGAIGELYLIVV